MLMLAADVQVDCSCMIPVERNCCSHSHGFNHPVNLSDACKTETFVTFAFDAWAVG